jgi:branched-chain amino acid aminotransferase
MQPHLDRLETSAKLAKMPLKHERGLYQSELERTILAFQKLYTGVEVYCRIIVSRGAGRVGFPQEFVGETQSPYTIIALPIEGFAAEHPGQTPWNEKHLWLVDRQRMSKKALTPEIKSGNYLNNILACLEARELGADDAVLLNSDGHVTEGSTFNIFWFKDGVLKTSDLSVGILDGITRRHLLEYARSTGRSADEVLATREEFLSCDECFLTSSTKEIVPVVRLNDRPVGDGEVGRQTIALAEGFHRWVLERLDPPLSTQSDLTVEGAQA